MANLKFKVGGVWNQIVTIKGDKGDPGNALPAGGVAGQLLIKNSATNNDATWQNNPSAPLSHTHTIANVTGLQSALDGKVDDSQVLTNVPAGAVFTDTVYTHPTTDGNLHVPATGTTNNGKVLKAGATAGSLVWGTDNDTVYIHPASHHASIITQDASNRFVTDAEKTTWNGKQNALVSGTNIKTINGNSVLGSGDVELLPKNNPTATGTVTLPNTTSIGNVSAAEIAFLDGVTSNIQAQFGAKAPLFNALLTGNIGLNSWLTFQRTFVGSGGTGVFESASVFGSNVPTAGLLIVSEVGTNRYWIGMLKKDNDAEAVQHFVISNSGLSVLATNASGTVAIQGFTNTNNVVIKSFIIKMT